jgi:hypothetical protein
MDYLRFARRLVGSRNLCLAGGVAFNCVANAGVVACGEFDQIFIQPAAGDAGTSIGAALVAECDNKRSYPRSSQEHTLSHIVIRKGNQLVAREPNNKRRCGNGGSGLRPRRPKRPARTQYPLGQRCQSPVMLKVSNSLRTLPQGRSSGSRWPSRPCARPSDVLLPGASGNTCRTR